MTTAVDDAKKRAHYYFPVGEHEFAIRCVRQILNFKGMVMVCFEGRCAGSDVTDLVGKPVAYLAILPYYATVPAAQLAEASGDAVIRHCVEEAVNRHEHLARIREADLCPGKTPQQICSTFGLPDTSYEVDARVHVSAFEKRAASGTALMGFKFTPAKAAPVSV